DDYRAALQLVHRNAKQLARTVDALVAAARHETRTVRATADAFVVATGAADACAGVAAALEIELQVDRPPLPIRLGVVHELAERILQPVIENACRYGHRVTRVSIERTPTAVVYT